MKLKMREFRKYTPDECQMKKLKVDIIKLEWINTSNRYLDS